jgi:CMP-N-acetylneuraminic acid synthetase
MKTIAVVPIKLTNERLPGKNIKLLGGRPLLQYILNTLTMTSSIDEIYVFCSDESIRNYLPQGVTFLKRNKDLDLPTSNFNQIFDSFMMEVHADIYVYAHATAPFLSTITIKDCIDKVRTAQYDSAYTASKIQDYLWSNGQPVNFDATNLPRSQDLHAIYKETSGIYVFTKNVYLKTHRRIGENPYIKEVSFKETIDINTTEDFNLAQYLLNY